MKVTITVIAMALLLLVLASGVAACGTAEAAVTAPASNPDVVKGMQTGPAWSHQLIIDGGAPVAPEPACSPQVIQ